MPRLPHSTELIYQSANVARFLLNVVKWNFKQQRIAFHEKNITYSNYHIAMSAYQKHLKIEETNAYVVPNKDFIPSQAEIKNEYNVDAIIGARNKLGRGRIVAANPANANHALGLLTRARDGTAEEYLAYNSSLLFDVFQVLVDDGYTEEADNILKLYFNQLVKNDGAFKTNKEIVDNDWLDMGDKIRSFCETDHKFNLRDEKACLHRNVLFFNTEYHLVNCQKDPMQKEALKKPYKKIPDVFMHEIISDASQFILADIVSVAALNLNILLGPYADCAYVIGDKRGDVEKVTKGKIDAMISKSDLANANFFIGCGLGNGAFKNDPIMSASLHFKLISETHSNVCEIIFAIGGNDDAAQKTREAYQTYVHTYSSLEIAKNATLKLSTERVSLPKDEHEDREKFAIIVGVNPKLKPTDGLFLQLAQDKNFNSSLAKVQKTAAAIQYQNEAEELKNPISKKMKMMFTESVKLHESQDGITQYYGVSPRVSPDDVSKYMPKIFLKTRQASVAGSLDSAKEDLTEGYRSAFQQAIDNGCRIIKFTLIGSGKQHLLSPNESLDCAFKAARDVKIVGDAKIKFVAVGVNIEALSQLYTKVSDELEKKIVAYKQ